VSALFERVAVVGLGLLGGSVALAARKRGVATTVVGVGRRRAPLEDALARGVVDEIGTVEEACEGADFVILATPVNSMPAVVRAMAGVLAPGAIVTDVGSVKGVLADTLPGLLPAGVHYVGSHPMAGSHLRGNEHAREDLLVDACCVVIPAGEEAGRDAVARVQRFWTALGARVEERSPADHDEQVGWVSHVPHVLAFAYANALAKAPDAARALAGGGYRDFTRIAHSDPELWAEILGANRKALAGALADTANALAELSRAIEDGDGEALEQLLASASNSLTGDASAPFSLSEPAEEDVEQ